MFTSAKEWHATNQSSPLRAYLLWLTVVLELYTPCRWDRRFKQDSTHWRLLYL